MDRNEICSCEMSNSKHFWTQHCSHHNDIRCSDHELNERVVEVRGRVDYLLVYKYLGNLSQLM